MHVACDTFATHELGEVVVVHGVLSHVLAGEVEHHTKGGVLDDVKSLTSVLCTETPPEVLVGGVVRIGNHLGSHVGDGVGGLYIGVATHVLTTNGAASIHRLAAGKVFHHDGVVEHTGVDQQLLLSGTQVFITRGIVPRITLGQRCIGLKELVPCFVVGHEHGLGAGTAQNLS